MCKYQSSLFLLKEHLFYLLFENNKKKKKNILLVFMEYVWSSSIISRNYFLHSSQFSHEPTVDDVYELLKPRS
jgi:hypothetical protein